MYCAIVGDAATAPELRIVVVAGVTADIVQTPAPMLITWIVVPVAYATDAFVGILNVLALAFDTVLKAPAQAATVA